MLSGLVSLTRVVLVTYTVNARLVYQVDSVNRQNMAILNVNTGSA